MFGDAIGSLTLEQANERHKIMERGMKMMDAIATTFGEDDPRFWGAMQVTLNEVDAFDKRHGIK